MGTAAGVTFNWFASSLSVCAGFSFNRAWSSKSSNFFGWPDGYLSSVEKSSPLNLLNQFLDVASDGADSP